MNKLKEIEEERQAEEVRIGEKDQKKRGLVRENARDIIKNVNNSDKLAYALSWLINGNDKLFGELSQGTFDELVDAVSEAYSLISVENFIKLSALAKNVALLTAKQRQ